MILIKKLEVHDFKQLEDVRLWFPDRGSFLIEGANEAGKSSLFEAVFFGLFGETLVGDNPDLVNYSDLARKAAVYLEVNAENETLLVHREVSKAGKQTALLIIRGPDGREIDRISRVNTVKERIEKSLKLDQDAFKNSCFVEQKKLGQLEELKANDRRKALSKLINLDFMLKLEDDFKVFPEDRDKLQTLRDREELAKVRDELKPVEEKLKNAERRLKLISLKKALHSLRSNAEEISRWRVQAEELENSKKKIKAESETFDRLQSTMTELRLLINIKDTKDNLTRQVASVQEELESLRKKADSLPDLEKQALRLRHLQRKWDQIQELEEKTKEAQGRLNSLAQEIENLKKKEEEKERLENEKGGIQSQRQELEKALGKTCRSLKLVLTLASLFLSAPLVLALIMALGILPLYFLFSLALLIPGIYYLLEFLQTRRSLKKLRDTRGELVEAQQKLAGKIEAYSAPSITPKGAFSLKELEQTQSFWALRKKRIEDWVSFWKRKLEEMGEPYGARTRDEVIGILTRTLGRIEDLRKETLRLSERKNYLEGLTQLLEKTASEEKKHLEALFSLEPSLNLEESAMKATFQELQKRAQEMGGKELRFKLNDLESKIGNLRGMMSLKEKENQKLNEEAVQAANELNIACENIPDLEEYPEIRPLDLAEEGSCKEERDSLFAEKEALRRKESELSEKQGLKGIPLDYQHCQKEREEWEHHLRVREKARQVLSITREAIYNRVKPQTEYHMSLILPLLTSNRYQEAQLTEDYKIKVWDERARAYREKEIFSGGTQDQFSLALRLAFAMATLPQERGSSPGFIFLDEPFSSSDINRTMALVELLTRGVIHEAFSQVFVISHSSVVNPDDFDYYIYLENGKIVKNTVEEIHGYREAELKNATGETLFS